MAQHRIPSPDSFNERRTFLAPFPTAQTPDPAVSRTDRYYNPREQPGGYYEAPNVVIDRRMDHSLYGPTPPSPAEIRIPGGRPDVDFQSIHERYPIEHPATSAQRRHRNTPTSEYVYPAIQVDRYADAGTTRIIYDHPSTPTPGYVSPGRSPDRPTYTSNPTDSDNFYDRASANYHNYGRPESAAFSSFAPINMSPYHDQLGTGIVFM